jgi:hypothetical protein
MRYMKRPTLYPIVAAIAAHDRPAALAAIASALDGEPGKHWNRDLPKLAEFIRDGAPRFTVFAEDGNGKLPFLAWSSLPGVGFCPGAGECLQFCYSFKAWRYPAAFARQAQNAWLLHSAGGRREILAALDHFEVPGPLDFRLYVDGDFGSVAHVEFWFDALRARPWLAAYGYSKSFKQLLAYSGKYPDNYRMNLSSGHKHSPETVAAIKRLPIVRGDFINVSLGRKVRTSDHGNRAHNVELRAAFARIDDRKAFTCPGKCGDCTPHGHACGSPRFAGVPVIIATH